jgi:hypothetical protein
VRISVKAVAAILCVTGSAAYAQSPSVMLPITPDKAAPALKPSVTGAPAGVPAPDALPPGVTLPAQPAGPMTLMLRGLDKITGRPTNISAPIGKTVSFATLSITARYCYSTPASETPETAAFVQIDDHRANQPSKRVFSGWMYASSPGLNAVQHPLYDVWVINCTSSAAPAAIASTAPVKVAAPDSSDKEKTEALPAEAGR